MKGTIFGYVCNSYQTMVGLIAQCEREVGFTAVRENDPSEKLLCLNREEQLRIGEPPEQYYREFDAITEKIRKTGKLTEEDRRIILGPLSSASCNVGMNCVWE